jgi:hypothetical protein
VRNAIGCLPRLPTAYLVLVSLQYGDYKPYFRHVDVVPSSGAGGERFEMLHPDSEDASNILQPRTLGTEFDEIQKGTTSLGAHIATDS